MKILFLTVSTGNGHNSCARAMEEYLKGQGVETFMLDVYEYISPALGKTVSDMYLFASCKIPKIYGKFYSFEERGRGKFLSTIDGFNILISKKICEYINNMKIDVVVATHLFAGQVLTHIKDEIDTINVGIVTDYTIHPHWENTSLDYYVTADEALTRQGVLRGIPAQSIKAFGIPINLKFAETRKKEEAKKALGFSDAPLVFLMMGSMGYGNMTKILSEVDNGTEEYNVVVVCGNNQKALKLINKVKFRRNVTSYGFIHNVDELMDAADCIITKPGGLTVTESLAKGLPMIYVDPIPGQEDRNVEFLVNNGVGIMTSRTYSIGEALSLLFSNPYRRPELCTAIKRLAKPYAAKTTGDFLIHLILEKGEKQ